jgi:hypothetical protein
VARRPVTAVREMYPSRPPRTLIGVPQPAGPSRVVITVTSTARAYALFISDLQPSQQPTSAQVAAAIQASLRGRGIAGCVAAAAAEYGEHPDTAPLRMRWALRLATVGAVPTPAMAA